MEVQTIDKGAQVKVRDPGSGERGTWTVTGRVAGSTPDDPSYDVTHTVSGRRRIFRSSRLSVVRPARVS